MEKDKIEALRQPVAAEVAAFAESLANRSQDLATRFANRLEPITTSAHPLTCEETKDDREYPPLFSSLRNSLFAFQSALDRMEDILCRCEL